jgi:hypothetical protein
MSDIEHLKLPTNGSEGSGTCQSMSPKQVNIRKHFKIQRRREERWVVLWVQLEDRPEENSRKNLEFREVKSILTTLRFYAKKGRKANISLIDRIRFMFEELNEEP